MNIVETTNLYFSYNKNPLIKDISLQIKEGAIYGLLGRNGSGKSTLLKLLMNLLKPKSGDIKFFGVSNNNPLIFNKIGCLIENPALYGNLSVEEHLKMLNILFKRDKEEIHQTLEIVGMIDERAKKSSKLSMGQKQRLGIAMALFNQPEVLVLDEPINGLDPVGVIEIRELLLNLQSQGKTILLSSHIISEMEKLCSDIGIIEAGELKCQFSIANMPNKNLEEFYMDILRKK